MSVLIKSASYQASDITGTWLNKDKDAHIQIYEQDGKYYGKIVWLLTPIDPETGKPKLDKHNPKDALKTRPIMGLLILAGLTWNADDQQWTGGAVYDPKSGNKYNLECSLTDQNTMELRGYLGISLMGRTDIWTRVVE
jgi:uncharacterized protein (DUF2147 family)